MTIGAPIRFRVKRGCRAPPKRRVDDLCVCACGKSSARPISAPGAGWMRREDLMRRVGLVLAVLMSGMVAACSSAGGGRPPCATASLAPPLRAPARGAASWACRPARTTDRASARAWGALAPRRPTWRAPATARAVLAATTAAGANAARARWGRCATVAPALPVPMRALPRARAVPAVTTAAAGRAATAGPVAPATR